MNQSLASPDTLVSHDRRRAARRTTADLAAYHWCGSQPRQEIVRDISATGVFLFTHEYWLPGDVVSLILQRSGPIEVDTEQRIGMQARAVRREPDGVGLSFVLPAGVDLHLWDSPLMASSEHYAPEDILLQFRVAQSVAFVQRLCPSDATELVWLLREGLSNYRLASATEIALRAERMLALRPNADRMTALPHLVRRILEDGSWADDEDTQKFWAGLLASSCKLNGSDDSTTVFVSLLSQLTATQVRLLTAACLRGVKYLGGRERVAARAITLSAIELMETTGSHDLIRIHRDLEHLADLGLLTVTVRSVSFSPIQGTDIAATGLGLQLYARCCGHRGSTQDFYHMPLFVTPGLEVQLDGQSGQTAASSQV